MKFANKEFSEYWKFIKVPTYVLIAWGTLSLIAGIISFSLYSTIFSPLAGVILTLAVFGFIGWTTVKDHKQGVRISAWAGALAGIISGFVGAILGIFMFYLVPEVIQATIAQAGTEAAAIESFLKIGIYIRLITGPLFSGIFGAIISAITAFIAKKV